MKRSRKIGWIEGISWIGILFGPYRFIPVGLALVGCLGGNQVAPALEEPAKPGRYKHQITGLFCPERQKDLREAFEKLPKFKLIAIDYDNAEITVEYDPAKTWPGEKPDRFVELFSNEISNASKYTFRAKPLRVKPAEKLRRVQIGVEGLDCLGCSYGAYRIVFELPGVEMATADFKTGLITALIDPEITNRENLMNALKKAGVEIKSPAK